MKKDGLLLGITTGLAVIVCVFSFTLAIAYLQIPKEIPTPEEIEIAEKELKEELPKVTERQKIKKDVPGKKMAVTEKTEIKEKVLPYYLGLINKMGTKTAKIVIILDDAGYSINGFTKLFFQTRVPLTFSVLPGLKYSKAIANMAHENGMEVMLHMPMEYCGNSKTTAEDKLCQADHNMHPYKYAILTGMSKEVVEKELTGAINDIPHVVGINNHMGSKATADKELMSFVIDTAKTKNLYFIDSVTTGRSVAYKLAKLSAQRTNKRDVFLDNINDKEYVKERICELIYRAKCKGYAIGIGHATKVATAEALAEMVPKLKEYGIEVVPASELVN
ncbi:MAG: divergent polysaccharide deacetylase family protein [bacterium]|nr:divergent polysaccharide deacetylase family protein [bacterium]